MRVMRTGAGELSQVGGEHVVPPATRAPRGEARGNVLAMLKIVDRCTKLGRRIRPVHQNARVAGVELPLDGFRTAAARVHAPAFAQGLATAPYLWQTLFLIQTPFNEGYREHQNGRIQGHD